MAKNLLKLQNKMGLTRDEGSCAIRVSHRKAQKKKAPRYLFKCGCCDQKFEIWYDEDGRSLEINGVEGSIENWREIFLPLLLIKETKEGLLVDARTEL